MPADHSLRTMLHRALVATIAHAAREAILAASRIVGPISRPAEVSPCRVIAAEVRGVPHEHGDMVRTAVAAMPSLSFVQGAIP